ncbi:ATP12 family chaperone protein [Novosphingobium colocasiae]|uniref:ATP12 family chaperone protein n=1 Tax=Novosphingobium colocasiae TaxID=1256513 RepID=UPI0035B1B2E2
MKRFYQDVSVSAQDGGWRVLLDGRPIRTAGGKPQVVPGRPLAAALADEWAAQGEEIDPARFRLRDLADYAIDALEGDRAATVAELLGYAGTDTLCYRADPDEPLHRRQLDVWEPLLRDAESRWGVRFTRVSGVMHRPQPAETLARLEAELAGQDAFQLAALRMLTSLAASLTIALLAIAPDADGAALWNAANLEEDWQVELWGEDVLAAENRAARAEAFALAIRFATLARAG